jgi:hypothetical protein
MDDSATQPHCINCQRPVTQVPLLALTHREGQSYICPQCLPYLIHNPELLVGKLAGAEALQPHNH